jgi:hypothetical protein
MAELIYEGFAGDDAPDHRGWLLGHFMPPGDPRQSEAVEIKWGAHARGERHQDRGTGDRRATAVFLISGRFRVDLPGRSVVLDRQGAYVVYRDVVHSWVAEEDCLVMCVRWPSPPGC